MASAPTGTRLKALREQRGMSQEELSRILGFDFRQTLQQIEAGQRRLSAEELVIAVREFGVPLDYFTNPYLIVGEARFSWRRRAEMDLADVDAFERKAGEWIGAYRELSVALGKTLWPIAHRLNLTRASSFEDATEAGEAVAGFLDLGSVPSERLSQAMQDRMGTLVLMVDAPKGISGAACLVRNLGVVLVNRQEAPGRRNYDLAHELFHILTWDAMPPERFDDGEGSGKLQKRVEQMANKFAAAILMPSELFSDIKINAKDHNWLNATANHLGVTAVALKWRLVEMGHLDQRTASSYNDELLRNNGIKDVRMRNLPPLFSKKFMEVMSLAIKTKRVDANFISNLLNIETDDLANIFSSYAISVHV